MVYINLATYPTAFFRPGGGEVQLLSTFKKLSKINKNINLLKNYDKKIISETSLFHLFTVCYSIETYVNAINEMDKKYLLSPIHWPLKGEVSDNEKNRIKHILSNSLKILTNSNLEAKLINNFYKLDRINDFVKVVNGVNEKMFKFSKSFKQRENTKDKKRVLFCGNIDQRKNLIRLLRCCEKGNYQLTIAGGIRDQKIFEIIKSNENVNYFGEYIPHSNDHIKLLTNHDVFCLPSFYETPGLAALEAAVVGIPIVITKEGCTKEYFGDNVFYCDPFKDESILSALENALAKGHLDHEFIEYVMEFYTWEKAAQKTNSIYKTFV